MGEPAKVEAFHIGRVLGEFGKTNLPEFQSVQTLVRTKFDEIMNFMERRPDLCKIVARYPKDSSSVDDLRLLSDALVKRFQKSPDHDTNENEEKEDELGIIGIRLQGIYARNWFDKDLLFDFQEATVEFINALNNQYDPSDEHNKEGSGDLLECDEDDEDGVEVGRMLDADDIVSLKIIGSVAQTYFNYIESERSHIKSTKDERNIFNREFKSGRIFYIREIIDALRAILFESYLCECINRREFKYTDNVIRKLIEQWDKYRMEVHFAL